MVTFISNGKIISHAIFIKRIHTVIFVGRSSQMNHEHKNGT
ncbi:hypothetical protein [Peribacillus simplex]|nr:hypothetical protein [Peribacillus simplex]WHY59156.1 hypothetical protein QNH43_13260 [Peribacillus simplex]